jgi:peptidoglycan/LPS O-acetylase OafA/YrhL
VRGIIGSAAVSAIFFVANFRAANHPASMSVFLPHRSLALEEQFYLLWPPVLFVLLRRARLRPRAVVAVTAGLTGVALAWRAYNLHRVSLTAVLYRPDLRADPILLGCVAGLVVGLGLVPSTPWFRTAVRTVAVAGAVSVGVFMVRFEWFDGRGRLAVGLLGVAVASAALILERVAAPTRLFSFLLERPVLMWLGRISYCLYLVHVPVIVCTREFVTGTRADLFAIGLAVAAAVVLHRTIEAPFLALKRTIRLPEPTTEAQPS